MANTRVGRDLLEIPNVGLPVVSVKKNEVRYYVGEKNDQSEFVSDFRVGAKWGNIIRSRFSQFRSAAKYFEVSAWGQAGKSMFALGDARVLGLTLTAYPDADPETTTVDGWVNTDRLSGTWAGARALATGASASDTDTKMYAHVGRETAPGEYNIFRNFILFDTSALTASATISAATIAITSSGSTQNNDNDGNDYLGITTSTPASNTAIVTADFDQVSFTEQHDAGQRKDWDALQTADTVGTFTLNATGIGNVSKTGVSKFAALEGHDIQNDAYAGGTNSATNINFYASDQTGTSKDPVLTVTYTVPSTFIPKIIIT